MHDVILIRQIIDECSAEGPTPEVSIDKRAYLPSMIRYAAIDDNTYDGAVDSGSDIYGFGHSVCSATIELLENLIGTEFYSTDLLYKLIKNLAKEGDLAKEGELARG